MIERHLVKLEAMPERSLSDRIFKVALLSNLIWD